MKVVAGLWHLLRASLLVVAAIVLFIEEWGWRPLTAMAARLAQWPPLARLEARIVKAPPRLALLLFLAPATLLFPLKIVALWFIDKGRAELGIFLILLGLVVVGNIDFLIRPIIFRRYAKVHPFVTVVGALAGIRYFGLMGLLVGPLAISYFFELLTMFHDEFLAPATLPTATP